MIGVCRTVLLLVLTAVPEAMNGHTPKLMPRLLKLLLLALAQRISNKPTLCEKTKTSFFGLVFI